MSGSASHLSRGTNTESCPSLRTLERRCRVTFTLSIRLRSSTSITCASTRRSSIGFHHPARYSLHSPPPKATPGYSSSQRSRSSSCPRPPSAALDLLSALMRFSQASRAALTIGAPIRDQYPFEPFPGCLGFWLAVEFFLRGVHQNLSARVCGPLWGRPVWLTTI